MLVTPHVYQLSQVPDKGLRNDIPKNFHSLAGWWYNAADYRHAAEMLLIHQTGAVKVGEVVRYTLTYTPSLDRILPAPTHLHVKIRNTSAIPLRAAYLHGPYTLYAACYPSTFDPNHQHENYASEGIPEFEPTLKAGGSWTSKLTIPEDVREAAGGPKTRQSLEGRPRRFTWVIEVASQILFSTTATVHYELLVGRDERSVDLGFQGVVGTVHKPVGKLEDHQKSSRHNLAQSKGVFSKAVHLVVEDTESLWNSPELPSFDEDLADKHQAGNDDNRSEEGAAEDEEQHRRTYQRDKRQKVHLVILTHGLHSNVGADMLYVKESIDACAKEAREAAKRDRARKREAKRQARAEEQVRAPAQGSKSTPELLVTSAQSDLEEGDEASDEEEQVIVRGFSGNAVKTERGIQYLGKRLAKYVLSITYPDQPYLPVKSSISRSISRSFTGQKDLDSGKASHKGSSIHRDDKHLNENLAYKITSISFIAHSLGGLVQTYAIAYINKHSPEFFDLIKPINFVAMATPFLGLSNENPIYVKFALDFGLVGRTGQDLGLTWRAPNVVRSGWGAMIGGLGKDAQKTHDSHPDPGSKPLLRILPTGPAHSALKKFRNRTVYSNVVNDGIVPLRTSCLLFLDWRGLERVEKARRENGLVGTMAGWGWAELTGQNASSPRNKSFWSDIFNDNEDSDSVKTETGRKHGEDVPQPSEEATTEDNITNSEITHEPGNHQFLADQTNSKASSQQPSAWTGLLSMFKLSEPKSQPRPPKSSKIYQRGQTMKMQQEESETTEQAPSNAIDSKSRVRPVRGSSFYNESSTNELLAPPKTSIFESAGDVLNPPLPPKEFIIDPSSRAKTIFHDRVYHPQDIPPPPAKKQRSGIMQRSFSSESMRQSTDPTGLGADTRPTSGDGVPGSMKVEEKIARAYHHGLSWRKVLVRLEPDAHNNIIVRRMFANAYGWPVVQHLCDTHFAYTAAARTRDEDESNEERAKGKEEVIGSDGETVDGQRDPPPSSSTDPERAASADDYTQKASKSFKPESFRPRSESEAREMRDEITDLKASTFSSSHSGSTRAQSLFRSDSAKWSDQFFEGSDDDSDLDLEQGPPRLRKGARDAAESDEPQVTNVLSSSPVEDKSLDVPPEIVTAQSSPAQQIKGGPAPLEETVGLGVGSLGPPTTSKVQTTASQGENRPTTHLGISEQVAFAQSRKSPDNSSNA